MKKKTKNKKKIKGGETVNRKRKRKTTRNIKRNT